MTEKDEKDFKNAKKSQICGENYVSVNNPVL